MSSQLSQLDADAVLMLYLAGEMEALESEQLDRQLVQDSELSARLDRLRDAQERAWAGLDQLDEGQPVNVSVAHRRASRAIRQWQARPAPAKVAAPSRKQLRLRRWAIGGAAAAAAALVASIISWTHSTDRPTFVRQSMPLTAPASAYDEGQLQRDAVESLASDDGSLVDGSGESPDQAMTLLPAKDQVAVSSSDSSSGDRPWFDVPLPDSEGLDP